MFAQTADIRESTAHRDQVRGNNRRQNSSHSLIAQPFANSHYTLGRKLVGVEINIGVSVNLQVDIAAWSIHNH